jgi:hypothetical protein
VRLPVHGLFVEIARLRLVGLFRQDGVETDDLTGPIEGHVRLRRPHFRIAVVVLLAALLIGAGYLGPHPAPLPTPSAGTTLLAVNPTPASSASSASHTPRANLLAGLTKVTPGPGQIAQTWLPGEISSRSMAVLGATLYFIVDGDRIESAAVGGDGSWQTVAQAPACGGINQLAAAGHELAYVVTDCGGAAQVSWSVWLLDLRAGGPHRVAQGIRTASSIDSAQFPIHLAVTDSAYAFDRPPSSAAAGLGEAVEVHSLDGRLLWTSHTQSPVADVMLGGGTLAILTDATTQTDGAVDLYTSTAARPDLAPVDQPASSASLSADGLHLTWDVPYRGQFPGAVAASDVAIETVDSGFTKPLTTLTDPIAPVPLRPAISSTDGGLLVSWFATAPDGAVYPAVRYEAGGNGAFLPSLQEPIWMSVQNNTLFWVAESADGWSKVAFAVDLAILGLS